MRTLPLVAGTTLALVAAGNAVMWLRVWGPEARAHEVADVLSRRSFDADVLDDSIPDRVRKTSLRVRDAAGLADAVHDSQWATDELIRLAKKHPAALAHAAARERNPDVRFAFLDVIEDTPAYASEVPAAIRVEHVASHAVARLDRPAGKPLNVEQRAALVGAKEDALKSLRALLVHGHCGALAGYEAVGAKPQPDEIAAAAGAIAAASADPDSDLTALAQDHCRERLSELAAPGTDGNLRVTAPAH